MITFSGLVISIVTLIFIIITILSIYRFESNFFIKKVKITDAEEIWSIITNQKLFYTWWSIFKNNSNNQTTNQTKVLLNNPLGQFKLSVKKHKKPAQIWSFNLIEDKKNTYLAIKLQILTNNIFTHFLAKYIKNKIMVTHYIDDIDKTLKDKQYRLTQKNTHYKNKIK